MCARTLMLAVLASLGLHSAGASAGTCERALLQQRKIILCSMDLDRQTIRTYWKSAGDEAYGSLSDIARKAQPQPGRMVFAMNAGMYHSDLSPVGLYVENGATLKAANLSRGPGNFHMLPNGVFHVTGRRAGVTEARAFAKAGARADFASQSGPMLVIGRRLHPKITGAGTSAKIRNGVGVRGAQAFFILSDEPVTFTEFARMFRDDLKTPNALYFDGSISSIYAPSVGRADSFMPVGPIVAGFDR